MIRYLEEPAELLPIAAREPALGCLMMNWSIAYHGDPFPADIWLVCEDGAVRGAVGVLGRDVYVLNHEAEPTSELVNFVMLLSAGDAEGVFCGERYGLTLEGLPGFTRHTQPVLRYLSAPQTDVAPVSMEEPRQLSDCWELLAPESPDLAASDREAWMVRLGRGIRRRQTTVLMVYDGDRPAAVAMIRGRTEDTGLIESVATLPEYRQRGYASALVSALVKQLETEGRTPYIVPRDEYGEKLYKKLGFRQDYTQCYFGIGEA